VDTKVYLIALMALASAASPSNPAVTYHERVGDSLFRVSIKDGKVIVARKSFLVGRTVDNFTNMRIAVRQATGCEITDEIWEGATLKARLDCDKRRP